MSEPKRIQRKQSKGWRMPEGAVYVGHPTVWGNPYSVGLNDDAPFLPSGSVLTRQGAVDCYADMVRGGGPTLLDSEWHYPMVGAAIANLRGKDLACWCPLDQPCHADVLLEVANGPKPSEAKKEAG